MAQSFAPIKYFVVKFAPHPSDPQASVQLNTLYQDAIPQDERLFVDPSSKTDVLGDSQLNNIVRDILINEMIGLTNAIETTDINEIKNALQNAPLTVHFANQKFRLKRDTLISAMEHALATNSNTVEIRVSINHLYFDTSAGPINFLDWSKILTTAPPRPSSVANAPGATSAPVMSPALFGSAVASALQASAPMLSSAFASAMPSVTTSGTTPTVAASTSATTAQSASLFNSKALPSDVLTRYENKMHGGLISGTMAKSPFAGGFLYHLEGSDKLILSDGTFFLIQTPNEKGLFKAIVSCEDDTYSGIRSWYDNFAKACHDYGYYVHPLWCFRADHGGEKGFTVGDDPDDDLPRRMEIKISQMSNPIYRILLKKDMFPKNSRYSAIVRSCNGDGYRALKAVIFNSHPAFHPQPSTLITTYPRQKDSSMLEYYRLFLDFEQLRAFISDVNLTLDNDSELDIFLKNAKYGAYLNRVTRDERRLSSLAYKYHGSQLVETLEKFLMAPDSPVLQERAESRNRKPFRATTPSRPFRRALAPVNALAYISSADCSDDDSSANGSATDVDNDDDDLEQLGLNAINAPATGNDAVTYHRYAAAVHQITQDPSSANAPDCIACGGKHRFDKCSVLNNTDFLRGHYVRLCQLIKRDSAAKSAANGKPINRGSASTPPAKQRFIKQPSKAKMPLNFIDDEPPDHESDSSAGDDRDFQRGRA
jgi:hypothetical protein